MDSVSAVNPFNVTGRKHIYFLLKLVVRLCGPILFQIIHNSLFPKYPGTSIDPRKSREASLPHRKGAFLFSEKISSSLSAQLQAWAADGYEAALKKFVVKANTTPSLSFIKANIAAL